MLEECRMNRHVVILIIISLLLTGCGTEDRQTESVSGENMTVSGQSVSGAVVAESSVEEQYEISENEDLDENPGETILGRGGRTVTYPDSHETHMLRVEGNISSNQAWVDFL